MSTCDRPPDEMTDLALGHVAEPERSELLRHAAACASCGPALADLSTVADRLLHLAPEVDPPIGFETRAVARMVPSDALAPPRRRRRAALAALAASTAIVLLALAVAAGVAIGRDGSARGSSSATAGVVVSRSGDRIGVVEVEPGPSRLILTMDGESRWDGVWTCEVEDGAGRWVEVGRWSADDVTNHVWAAGLDPALRDATAMRILGDSGAVIATATLSEG